MTRLEMLQAINSLPEDKKGWSDVKRALRPEASDREIERCYRKRCEVIPELAAWQLVRRNYERISAMNKQVDDVMNVGDLTELLGVDLEALKQEQEDLRSAYAPKIAALLDEIRANVDLANEWARLTRSPEYPRP